MSRINVYTQPTHEYDPDGPQLAGWFNSKSADVYDEETEWDGRNEISVNQLGEFGHQALYRTKGGRWVLNTWSQRQGSADRYEFITDAIAKDWLLRNNQDEAFKKWFGELTEESGPNLGGRTAIGTKVEARLPDDTLEKLDLHAKSEGVSRAKMIRILVTEGLKGRVTN
ncbi:ribbon-helix-helix domain-containing protein [Streptomyces sp. NPDC000927]|uniref:ribbon-helix-helix domain-containing protein n=1 Tax=Streptomyces sp. NPDC000927 TaxID=3154371 RepID=UPI00332642FD